MILRRIVRFHIEILLSKFCHFQSFIIRCDFRCLCDEQTYDISNQIRSTEIAKEAN